MGDLNADCSYFDEDSDSTMSGSDYHWCINNSVDTTTKTTDCTYDRIIITNPALPDFTGDAGVFRFDIGYGLTANETTAVSDHYPVYAEFWCDQDADPHPTPDVADAVIALQIAVGSREYDPELDINSDGKATALDALMILQANLQRGIGVRLRPTRSSKHGHSDNSGRFSCHQYTVDRSM